MLRCDYLFQVLINPSSMPPLPELESILVSPGTASVFSLRKKEVKRLAEPYGNCSKHWPTDKINFSPEFIQQWPVYNQKVCEHYCRQRYLFDKCSCVKTFFRKLKITHTLQNVIVNYCSKILLL